MHAPYMRPVTIAAPDIVAPEPHVSPCARLLCRLVGRLYLRQFIGGAKAEARGEEHLIESFTRAFKNESRCIAAFLHPNGAEPQILEWFTLSRLKALAGKAGAVCAVQPHLRFVHGYEVLRWGGALARFILPRIGAMPVYHAKFDSHSMECIYKALTDGPYPVAIAPEGQVSYFSDRTPHLEQGPVRIGFTVAERLEKSGRLCPVEILPVSVQYCYNAGAVRAARAKKSMEKLLRRVERCVGVESRKERRGVVIPIEERLLLCRELILEKNEARYGIKAGEKADNFAGRVDALIEKCLDRTEKTLDVTKQGGVFARMYYLRQVCWDRIFIAGKTSLDDMVQLDRSIVDLNAGEAWHASRHLEIVDFVWYLRCAPVPAAESPLYQQVEYVQNLWDFANRTMGGVFGTRKLIHPYKVIVKTSAPINLSDHLDAYHRGRKETVKKVMAELEEKFFDLANSREEAE
ncbi:MAG: acyltransferase [Treponema sp.]|nr:acyltransferase [Treponema sp.]